MIWVYGLCEFLPWRYYKLHLVLEWVGSTVQNVLCSLSCAPYSDDDLRVFKEVTRVYCWLWHCKYWRIIFLLSCVNWILRNHSTGNLVFVYLFWFFFLCSLNFSSCLFVCPSVRAHLSYTFYQKLIIIDNKYSLGQGHLGKVKVTQNILVPHIRKSCFISTVYELVLIIYQTK